jgi:hypothetical protein
VFTKFNATKCCFNVHIVVPQCSQQDIITHIFHVWWIISFTKYNVRLLKFSNISLMHSYKTQWAWEIYRWYKKLYFMLHLFWNFVKLAQYFFLTSQDIWTGIVTKLWAGWPRNCGLLWNWECIDLYFYSPICVHHRALTQAQGLLLLHIVTIHQQQERISLFWLHEC